MTNGQAIKRLTISFVTGFMVVWIFLTALSEISGGIKRFGDMTDELKPVGEFQGESMAADDKPRCLGFGSQPAESVFWERGNDGWLDGPDGPEYAGPVSPKYEGPIGQASIWLRDKNHRGASPLTVIEIAIEQMQYEQTTPLGSDANARALVKVLEAKAILEGRSTETADGIPIIE